MHAHAAASSYLGSLEHSGLDSRDPITSGQDTGNVGGIREMDKLDLCLIPLVFLLRTAYFILQLVSTSSHRFYDYWFHSSNNVTLRSDFMSWFSYALIQCGLWFIHALYLSIEWIQVFPYRIPIISTFYAAMVFWPRFYWSILWDPDGRSIREIISNPTNEDQSAHLYLTKKQKKKSKIERRLRPSKSR